METELNSTGVIVAGIVVAVGIPLCRYILRIIRDQYTHLTGEPPLISGGIPILGCALEYGKNPWKYLSTLAKKHSVFTLYLAGRRMTYIMDQKLFPVLYRTPKSKIDFSHISAKFEKEVFRLVLNSKTNEEIHRAYTLLRGEHMNAIALEFRELLGEYCKTAFESFGYDTATNDGSKMVPIFEFSRRIFFNASVRAIFGDIDPTLVYEDFISFDGGFPLMVGGMPDFIISKFKKAEDRITTIMAKSLTPETSGKATEFIKKRESVFRDNGISDIYRLRGQFSILWASQANTLNGAFWTLAHIISNKEILRSVMSEISALGKNDLPHAQTVPILDACISEALRIYGHSHSIREVLVDDFTLATESGTLKFRKGDIVNLPSTVAHFDPINYKSNEMGDCETTFNAKRFTEKADGKDADGKENMYKFLAFGAGVSICPGRHLARSEIMVFVWKMLSMFEFQCEEGKLPPSDVTRSGLGVIGPIGDVEVRCKTKF
ncbi:Cytochrome P450 7B1 [Nowakowskiella sp. JEL0407]|nr:Cytochrome P450 7B1 [Nowakowskiella sp. JEL0407]